MNTPVRKWNMPLSLEEIQKSIKGNPKAVTESEKYGKAIWVEVTEWSDGGISASNFNSETKQGYKIGNNGKLKANTNNQAQQEPSNANATEKDFSFDL
jgi:hypothetical protein